MLAVEDLTVAYGRLPAVRNVSISVGASEAVAVIGPNGAGKTTTLTTIAGLLTPNRGEIRFEGASIRGMAPEKLVRRGIALVPEGRRILGRLTVAENLQLGATPRKVDRNTAKAELERVLARFPVLGTYYRSSAAKLSGGEQQQLAIARALLAGPRLLLLDEPSLGLGPRVVDLVFELLRELREEKISILLVEQNALRAIEFADRTYVFRSGGVAMEGHRDDLLAAPDFVETYLGA